MVKLVKKQLSCLGSDVTWLWKFMASLKKKCSQSVYLVCFPLQVKICLFSFCAQICLVEFFFSCQWCPYCLFYKVPKLIINRKNQVRNFKISYKEWRSALTSTVGHNRASKFMTMQTVKSQCLKLMSYRSWSKATTSFTTNQTRTIYTQKTCSL